MKMNLMNIAKPVLAAVVYCAAGFGCVSSVFGDVGEPPVKILPLVQTDSSLTDWLGRARQCIEDKDFGQAITILQALIERPDAGFISVGGSKSNFVSLRSEAIRLLGSIPQAGLESYRSLYDAKARQKLADAKAAGDLAGLAELAEVFRYTSVGGDILEVLAAMEFDRGLFLQAGRTWERFLVKSSGFEIAEGARALLLAKTAVAFYLAGESELARGYADRLKAEFPNAISVVGGEERNLVAFVSSVLSRPVKLTATTLPADENVYPGWGGLPTGRSRMSDCDVLLLPRWRYPKVAEESSNVFSNLVTKETLKSAILNPRQSYQSSSRMSAEFYKGRVIFGRRNVRSKGGISGQVLPPMLRPVVAGDKVIYRDDEVVRAVDIFTGKPRWESPLLPMQRSVDDEGRNNAYFYNLGGMFADRGQYGLTIGGDKVFTIHGFLPPNLIFRGMPAGLIGPGERDQNKKELNKGSVLSAISLESGKLLWSVGQGEGDEFLKTCKFISLPTFVPEGPGRLYIVALTTQSYELLCLDAASGRLIWKSQISQTPPISRNYGIGWAEMVKMIGTPPAVSGGRVFACTNTGVVAAFDAASGQPVWAYQYPSSLSSRRFLYSLRDSRGFNRDNPLIISGEKLIALPVDSLNVFALGTQDGNVLWEKPRDELDHLAFVDDGRLVLGSEKVRVLDSQTGDKIHEFSNPGGMERPVVTDKHILLAGSEGLVRISLADYSRSTVGPVQGGGLLGNFVSIGPALIAANPMGLCAYFSYETGYEVLTERMRDKSGAEQARLFLKRGALSFSAGKYDKTSEDLASCKAVLDGIASSDEKAAELRKALGHWRYVTELAKGDSAAGPESGQIMLSHFKRAFEIAPGSAEKACTLLRLAKCCEKFGEMGQAVEWAQKLSQDFPNEAVVDVAIGLEAIDPTGSSPTGHTEPGKQRGNEFIERLVKIHGRGIYAKFDSLGQAELDRAIAAGDAASLEDVARRWPLSLAATEAMFLAAEAYYREAGLQSGSAAVEAMAKVISLLCSVANETKHSRNASAMVGLVAIDTAAEWTQAARLTRNELEELSPETKIGFADIQGSLGEVLSAIDAGNVKVPVYSAPDKAGRTLTVDIKTPLVNKYDLADSFILTDQEYHPVRIGQVVLVQQGNRTVLLDTSADNMEQAAKNYMLSRIDVREIAQKGSLCPGMKIIAGRSNDGKSVVLCGGGVMTAFSAETGRVLWSRGSEYVGMVRMEVMGVGDDTLIVSDSRGKIVAVNFEDGTIRWRNKISLDLGPMTVKEVERRRRQAMVRSSAPGLRRQVGTIAPPVIGGGFAVFSYYDKDGYGLSIFDIRDGRLLKTLEGSDVAQAFITKSGLLVTMVDGQLAVYGAALFEGNSAMLELAYKAEQKPVILAVSNQYVAISPDQTSGKTKTVELISLHSATGTKKVELQIETGNNEVPVSAVFDGPALTVTVGLRVSASFQPKPVEPVLVRNPKLVKFDTNTGKQVWRSVLVSDKRQAGRVFMVAPFAMGRSGLAVEFRGAGLSRQCDIFDQDSGKMGQSLFGVDKSAGSDSAVMPGMPGGMVPGMPDVMPGMPGMLPGVPGRAVNSHQVNVPVITSGRLTVETDSGVSVYGE